MGQTHFSCYGSNPDAKVIAVADSVAEKLTVSAKVEGNIGSTAGLDLTGLKTTTNIQELIEDPEIDLLDFCVPTPAHAPLTIAALRAGKHVLCEKPIAFTLEECDAMRAAQRESGKFLLIGHCLRFWPQYLAAKELLDSGELGDLLYARFFRMSGAPSWSGWLMDGSQSGGAVLDMHIHDVDTALWWFGRPDTVNASGVVDAGLPLKVDATWTYANGPRVQIHGGWDRQGGPFSMGFELTGTQGTLFWDSSLGEAMQYRKAGQSRDITPTGPSGYQAEINYLIECIGKNEVPTRTTPESSRLSLEITLEELKQLGV
jgi:predicted dehydrogenase